MTGLSPDKDDLNRKKNILDTAQTFIDSHIRLVQVEKNMTKTLYLQHISV